MNYFPPDEQDAAAAARRELNRRRGARILLVEDNPINREVASLLLRGAGMDVSMAVNGQEAVEMARAMHYDLVLMDVQMPVMSGLEATVAIRRLPGWESVPILALTANAFQEDGLSWRHAGMDDHIAKPVEPEVLYKHLVRWLPARADAGAGAAAPAGPPSEQPADTPAETPAGSTAGSTAHPGPGVMARLASIPGLDYAAGVRSVGGDEASYLRLLEEFAQKQGQALPLLRELEKAGDRRGLESAAHTLKGVAGTLGARSAQDAAARLEAAAKHGGGQAVHDATAGLLTTVLPLVDELCAAFATEPEPAVTHPVDWPATLATLARLEDLLVVYDASANEVFDQASDLLIATLGDSAQRLGREIRSFDYGDALATLRALRIRATPADEA